MVNNDTNDVHELWEIDVNTKIAEAKKRLNEIILAHKYCSKVGGEPGGEMFAKSLIDNMIHAAREMAGMSVDDLGAPLEFPVDFEELRSKIKLETAADRFLFQAAHFMEEYKRTGHDDDKFMAQNYLRISQGADGKDLPRYKHLADALKKEIDAL